MIYSIELETPESTVAKIVLDFGFAKRRDADQSRVLLHKVDCERGKRKCVARTRN